MSTIQIQGYHALQGELEVQGSKNAVLPVMAAALLYKGITIIENVPGIQDVFCMMGILHSLGCRCEKTGSQIVIDAADVNQIRIPRDDVQQMRSSIMVLGPLLGRMGEAVTYYPGGCSIGKRPIDLHLSALRSLGAKIEEKDEEILAFAAQLTGGDIHFSFPSVGATENAVMAAVAAVGNTIIRGCAKEPEICELCYFLRTMGAVIHGIGTDTLVIEGGRELHSCTYRIAGDRIVAGTYMTAVMAAGGKATLKGIIPGQMRQTIQVFREIGAHIREDGSNLMISMDRRPKGGMHIITGPYPGFPTDLQSPVLAVLSLADGESIMEENIFEDRFETVKELRKFGAEIIIEKNRAYVAGYRPLKAACVEATDLRGGAALVVAALGCEGTSTIGRCRHIFRGYEDICRDLGMLGAVVNCRVES